MSVYDIGGVALSGDFDTVRIAASDSSTEAKNQADYVCTGTNDGVIIQAAIDSFGEKSGVIQLANGHYRLDTFSLHDGAYYGIYLPMLKREIIIRGVSHNHRSDNVSLDATDNAAVLIVTDEAYNQLPANEESYVIGSNKTRQFPYKSIGIEHLTIAIPDNKKPIIGVDGAYCYDMHVDGCFFRTGADPNDSSEINPRNVAIRTCGGGNIGYNFYLSHIKVIGWGTGYQVEGEHLLMTDCLAQRAAYGIIVGDYPNVVPHPTGKGTGDHSITLVDCSCEFISECMVFFGDGKPSNVKIVDLILEKYTDQRENWNCDRVFSALDDSPFYGSISYTISRINGGGNIQINAWDTTAHASKFRTVALDAPTNGPTSNRPTDPVYLCRYFDTDLNRTITWDGSAWVYEQGTVVQLRRSEMPMLHISLDDCQYCIKNLVDHTFDSIFDEPLLAMLKKFHVDYGAVFSIYVYNLEASGLVNAPTRYQVEFIKNADWLKFGFHQYSSGALDVNAETAKGYYNAFVDGIYNLCGGIASIDRMPRLDYYAGSLAVCQGLRDAKCGVVGLLTADDSRTSYYLTEAQADYIRAHSLMLDRNNGLAFMDTGFRLDWFVDGYTSDYQYTVPVKSNPYDELVYRYGQPDMGECFQNLVVFLHEWRVYNNSYQITASMKNMIEQVCRFGRDYGYDFEFPMNRVPNITSFALS